MARENAATFVYRPAVPASVLEALVECAIHLLACLRLRLLSRRAPRDSDDRPPWCAAGMSPALASETLIDAKKAVATGPAMEKQCGKHWPTAARNFGGIALELLRDGSVLGAVTGEAMPVRGCEVLALGAMRYQAIAAPEFAARHFHAGVRQCFTAAMPVVCSADAQCPHRHRRALPGQ